MDEVLSQYEIDDLVKAVNNHTLEDWISLHENYHHNNGRFKSGEVYTVEDYDLFYCNYALEKLTLSPSLLRRYAYGDTESFKRFEYFIVLEDFINQGINVVLVVGIPLKHLGELENTYDYYQDCGVTYLVDAASLTHVFNIVVTTTDSMSLS